MDFRRFISGALLIPLVSIPAYFGGFVYFALILCAASGAAYEYDGLMRHAGYKPERLWGFVFILLLLADAAFPGNGILHGGLPLFVMLTLAVPLLASDLNGALLNWALTLAGALYIGALLSQFIVLRQMHFGLELSAMAAISIWVCDSAAFVFGTRYGRHRFAPRISPKKSWEGAIGGGIIGLATAVLIGAFLIPAIPLYHIVILGVLIVISGIIGDLAESLIKRQVGAKDAGRLLPGHGGILDRIDSMMFAFPVTLLYAVWVLNLK